MQKRSLTLIFLAANLLFTACAEKQLHPSSIEMTPRERAASEVQVDPSAAAETISRYRHEHALSAVQPDPILQKFAQAQANVMAARDLLSHEVDGNLMRRLEAANLRQKTAVENVSAGYFSLPDVMAGWRRSPGHNANLLDPQMRRMGIATAYAPGTRYKVYWALVMSN
ncbi:MAG TPA: CAP domain-containing protein [Methylocella sp.]|nr:CAP domain-containing protein [Methylocella sp.]